MSEPKDPPEPPKDPPKGKEKELNIMDPNEQEKERIAKLEKEKMTGEIKDLQKAVETLPEAIAKALNPTPVKSTASAAPAPGATEKSFLDDLGNW